MEKIRLYANLERTIAHTDELEAQLGDFAYTILIRARGNLARHHRRGEHRVTQTKGKVDHFVNLEGPAPMSVEEGHFLGGFYANTESIRFVEGLHILRDAIGGV
jgi:hypothetical protein